MPDPTLQDSLQRLNEADPLQGEQTWPTAQVRQGLPSCLAPQFCSRPSRGLQSGLPLQLLCLAKMPGTSGHSTHEPGGSGLEALTRLLLDACWLTSAAGASRCLAATLWQYNLQRSHLLVQQQSCTDASQLLSTPCYLAVGALMHAMLPMLCRGWQVPLGQIL